MKRTHHFHLLALGALLAIPAPPAGAQLSPEKELATFQLEPPLRAELVAGDPTIESPCAMVFDERGRLFVTENRGYPHTSEPPQGRIIMLESTKGDGQMDKRTVFADGLTFPNGVLPWNGGLIVTCSPDVLFLKDTHGDGHADVRKVLLTGFDSSHSTQLRENCPTLGPDGWIYFAAGLVGGTVTSPDHPEMPAVKMTGDLRWNPRTGEFADVDGRSQYGISFDDFGRRFICMNRLPVQHQVISSATLRRNPHLAFSVTVQDCNELTVKTGLPGGGDGVRVYPISANITTADSHAGSFTAACSVKIWRGGALPEKFNGCALSCEPTGNLIHADRLVPRGATFFAQPILEKREIFSSSDDWCRPVFLTSGPDGALYFCDMYRKIIEHPDYLSEDIRKHSDFDAGKTMGRIWRITGAPKEGNKEALPAAFSKKDGWIEQALAVVADGNDWARQTALRLLLEGAEAPTISNIEKAHAAYKNPAGIAALLRLAGVIDERNSASNQKAADDHAIFEQMLATDARNPVAGVRESAIDAGKPKVEFDSNHANWAKALCSDPDARVRFELLVNGQFPNTPEAQNALAEIADRGVEDRWTRAAVLSVPNVDPMNIASSLLKKPATEDRVALVFEAARTAGSAARATGKPLDLEAICALGAEANFEFSAALMTGFIEGSNTRRIEPGACLSRLLSQAAQTAGQDDAGEILRKQAVNLLQHADWKTAEPGLLAVMNGHASFDLRSTAIRALASFDEAGVTQALLTPKHWSAISAAEREVTVAALLARPAHVPGVLDAVESNALPKNALTAAERRALSKSKDPAIRDRAAKLLGQPADGDRMKAYEAAKVSLPLKPAPAHGKEVFKNICSTCHRLDREGHAVGPDLLDIRSQPKDSILLHIVVPDFEIAPGFAASVVELKDGRTLVGIVISDTPDSITLRQPLAVEEIIPRANIVSLAASDHSLMPPGLEAAMTRQDMADLLSFLKGEN
jgi:putative membrane-bound dehydrogenase-like protein